MGLREFVAAWRPGSIARAHALPLIIQVVVIVSAVAVWLNLWSVNEVSRESGIRARWLAQSLSEGVRYGIMSGQINIVTDILQNKIGSPGLVSMEVVDQHHRPIAKVDDPAYLRQRADVVIEEPITVFAPEVEPLDSLETQVWGGVQEKRPQRKKVIGYVTVSVASEALFVERRQTVALSFVALVVLVFGAAFASYRLTAQSQRGLREVAAALKKIHRNEWNITLSEEGHPGEVGDLVRGVAIMVRELSRARDHLEERVKLRTAELEQQTIELANAHEQLMRMDKERQRLIAQTTQQIEEERKRIAFDIHDQVSASLTAARSYLDGIALAAQSAEAPIFQTIEERAKLASKSLSELYISARGMIRFLRPEVLDTLGLALALEDLVDASNAMQNETVFSFQCTGALPALSDQTQISAYRIVQEAISNIFKHAHASSVSVTAAFDPAGNCVRLSIQDNGAGFEADSRSAGVGLIGMRERAIAVGGSLKVASTPGFGTRIDVDIPLSPPP